MSVPLLLAMALCAVGGVEVTVAPDQPLPFVYVDDPLIIELVSAEEAVARVKLRLQATHRSEAAEITLGDALLPAGAPRWLAVKDDPHGRGAYTAEISLEIQGEIEKHTARYCRIDRPAAQRPLPLYAAVAGEADDRLLLALKSAGIRCVRLDAAHPDFAGAVSRAVAAGLSVVAGLNADAAPETVRETVKSLPEQHCARLLRWEIQYTGDNQAFAALLGAVKQGACPAPAAVVVPRPALFAQFLTGHPGTPLRQCVLATEGAPDPASIGEMRREAFRHGMDGWAFHAWWRPRNGEDASGGAMAARFFMLLRVGTGQFGVDAARISAGGELLEPAAWVNGLAVRLDGVAYAGDLPLAGGARAPLFRRNEKWTLALWGEGGAAKADIPLEGAAGVEWSDALGNPMPAPEPPSLTAESAPVYITGTGGVLPGRAATALANSLAEAFLGNDEYKTLTLNGLREVVTAIHAETGGASGRARFLDLLRLLPKVEELRQNGQAPAHTALPALHDLAALARALCLVEDDRGELFLEPLNDIIARCEELQSLYLTGTTAHDDGPTRGEWLLSEVRRLVDEAEALEQAGRRVEASAVAMLAEAWAQGLVVASKAPAAAPPAVAPPAAPSPPPAEKAAAPAAAAKPAQAQAKDSPAPEKQAGEVVHVVASGDNPSKIAAKYGVTVDNLLSWNNLKKSSRLNIGDKLVIRQPGKMPEAPKTGSSRRR